MTIIYITENNCKCYGATFENNGRVKVQKFEDISKDKNTIYEVNPIETFIGKSQPCNMTRFSGARDKEVFIGNTILLEVGKENNKHKHVYIGGNMVCSFLTADAICKYISNMGNSLTPYSIAIGWENIYYLTPYFRIIKKENIDVDDIDKLFDIDYDDIMSREKIEINKIHSNYDHVSTDDDNVSTDDDVNVDDEKTDFVTTMNQIFSK